jgi:class 3 adenylate cyclase
VEQQISYCTAADGVRVAYATYGNDGAPPLVYFPDMPGQEAIWASTWGRPFMEELAQHRRLITLDLGGFGASQRDVERPGRYDLFMSDLAAVADHLLLERFEIFASGMGPGIASIMYASEHPERVARLALFSPRIMSSDNDLSVAESVLASSKLFYRSSATLYFPGGPPDAQLWFSRTSRDWSSPEQFAAFMRGTFELSDILSRLTLPVLILHRKRSQVVAIAEIRMAASLVPGARLVTLDGDAGAPYWDFEQYIDTLRECLGVLSEGLSATQTGSAVSKGGLRTVLFTDLVGHTEMMQRLGDAKGREVLREHERITRELLKEYGGAEVKTMGDGFMASFGSVTKAMDCAIALQRAFAAHEGEPLQARVGLNAGEPIEEDGDLFGATVILASRIAARAGPGEILVPETVRGLLSGKGFVFGDRGEFVPKGFDEGVRIWDVRWRE